MLLFDQFIHYLNGLIHLLLAVSFIHVVHITGVPLELEYIEPRSHLVPHIERYWLHRGSGQNDPAARWYDLEPLVWVLEDVEKACC